MGGSMSEPVDFQQIKAYWNREGLAGRIMQVIEASGKDLRSLTIDDLAPLDQFHGGGKPSAVRLATLAGLSSGTRVLDVGGGFGGPARTLAVEFGCTVDVLDLTDSYIEAGRMLTALLGLEDRVRFHQGNALEIPFEDASFDAVWTQNSGMNIADKARLYAGFHRVIRPGGKLVFQEPMAGPVQPVIYPQMWSTDGSTSFLLTPDDLRQLIEAAGFRPLAWEDVTASTSAGPLAPPGTPPGIQALIMGDALPQIRANGNKAYEDRTLVNCYGVFERP